MSLTRFSEFFGQKMYLIPDYQRGYSWEDQQLEDFWKDIQWLNAEKTHYTGMITRHQIKPRDNGPQWQTYHLVDGQQRMTTSILLLNELIRQKNDGYMLGASVDFELQKYVKSRYYNDEYLVLDYEDSQKSDFFWNIINSTDYSNIEAANIYERNLLNAVVFFQIKIKSVSEKNIEEIYRKVIHQLAFDLHEVESTFDVCAMFESINYRGKKLSKFEVLKNRLIYLTEIIGSKEDSQNAILLRRNIHETWGIAFNCFGLGINVLDEDKFLQQHAIMYFGPLDNEKEALDKKLFKVEFTTDRLSDKASNPLTINELNNYVESLKISAEMWAYQNTGELLKKDSKIFFESRDVKILLLKIRRLSETALRPVILAALNKVYERKESVGDLVNFLVAAERFTFIVYELCDYSAKQARPKILKWANSLLEDENHHKLNDLILKMEHLILQEESDGIWDGLFDVDHIKEVVVGRFRSKKGWTDWNAIKYFLSEWKCHFKENDFIEQKDYLNMSIEHIFPQDPNANTEWHKQASLLGKKFKYISNDIGNMMLFPLGANKAVQDASLTAKSTVYSESGADGKDVISLAGKDFKWDEEKIWERGEKMLKFMLERWVLPHQEKESDFHLDFSDLISKKIKPIGGKSKEK